MKFHIRYFDMLDGKYRSAAQYGMILVISRSNRVARTKAKKQYKVFYAK